MEAVLLEENVVVAKPKMSKRAKLATFAVAMVGVVAVVAGTVATVHLRPSHHRLIGPNGEEVPIRPMSEYNEAADIVPAAVPKPEGDIDVSQIINIGKEIFQIVKDNAPVVTVQSDMANAIPAGATGWLDISGWKGPKSYGPWVWSRLNGFGVETARYEFNFGWRYGGSYKGSGLFMQQVTVENKKIAISWGHNADVTMNVSPPSNIGTDERPIASMSVTVKMVVKTPINHNEQTCKAVLNGDGSAKVLYCDNYAL